MNWKQLFCRHSWVPTSRHFVGMGTYWGNNPMDIEPKHNYVMTNECLKCGKITKFKSSCIANLDGPQPFDTEATSQLFTRS